MNIRYTLNSDTYSFKEENEKEFFKLSGLLSNPKGDALHLGLKDNSSKFQGLTFCNSKTLEHFKILDSVIPEGYEIEELEYNGYEIIRHHKGGESSEQKVTERFYLAPSGGLVYNVDAEPQATFFFDVDCREMNDFSEWGRVYSAYEEDTTVVVEFQKEGSDLKLFCVVKALEGAEIVLVKDWVKKEYLYSKERNTNWQWYVYRAFGVRLLHSKGKIVLGYGFSKEEALEQVSLLEGHNEELLSYNKTISNMLFARDAFRLPLTDNVDVSYRLARHGLYQFLNKKLENQLVKEGAYAGFPWFLQIWTRDELVSLKAYMDCGEERFVKEKLMSYLTKIEPETGMLKRIEKEDALYSADGTFWLAKRFDDFFTLLTRRGRLDKIFSKEERLFAFRQLCLAFQSIVEGSWDFQEELLQVKHGDSWMDTLDLHYPVDIQVQFLSFVSFLAKMASQLSLFEEHKKYADFENLYRQKIKKSYFRKGKLFNEVYEDMHTVNVFLCYYLYPDLLLKKDWESAFDAALSEMSSSWGGLASLSTKDSRFEPNYSGENDKSYHRGDSWYWINNYAAMAMQDLNEQKYRKSIRDILHASNRDIMELGTLGFSSELSSFSEQRAQGCFAQLWSHASYIELVDFLFEKKCLGPVLAEQKGELDFFSPFRLKHFAGLKEKISKQLTAMQVKQNFQGMFRRQSN